MIKKSKMSRASSGRDEHFSLIYLEKQFFSMPADIVLRSHQEIIYLKKQEIKIKSSLKKIQLQSERFQQTIIGLKKKNNTESQKKIARIQKVLQDSQKTVAILNKGLMEIESIYGAIAVRNAKFLAIKKLLTHFEKEWKIAKLPTKKTKSSFSTKTKTKFSVASKGKAVKLAKERGSAAKSKMN